VKRLLDAWAIYFTVCMTIAARCWWWLLIREILSRR
jgi:hypothetical protein